MSLSKMLLYSKTKCRLISIITLSVVFFFVEAIGGCITNSTALIADSFYLLTDIIAMFLSLMSAKVTTRKWKRNTFGWARADIMGTLIHAVFLYAVCVSTIINACRHFSEGSRIKEPESLAIIAILGLIVNFIGLRVFYKHGIGNSHPYYFGGQHNNLKVKKKLSSLSSFEEMSDVEIIDFEKGKMQRPHTKKSKSLNCEDIGDLNMRGAFLYILSDTLGSVIVLISALVAWKTDWSLRFYVDPALSLLWVCIILRTSWPLLRESSLILLQSVPSHINIEDLRKRLVSLDGVLDVHEFHVWQLEGQRIIATAHIHCENLAEYMSTAERVKEFFHNEGIHSTTIQPEFFQLEDVVDNSTDISVLDAEFCALSCPVTEEEDCFKNTCCQIKHKKMPKNRTFEKLLTTKRQSIFYEKNDLLSKVSYLKRTL